MSDTLARVRALASLGDVIISDHGYDELAADRISAKDVLAGLPVAIEIEDYPDAHKGPSVLALQTDSAGHAIHVVWGIAKGCVTPAVLVTAYRPDPSRWSADFMKRTTT